VEEKIANSLSLFIPQLLPLPLLYEKLKIRTTANCEERENQQDTTIRYLLSTSVSTCFGHHYAHLQENKNRVLLHMVYCAGSAGCGW